jgi:zinc transport system ATP-binding protein
MKNLALEIKDLNIYYPGLIHPAVESVSFSIEKGKIAAVIGPNGSGKTTLIKAILGLIDYQGEILVFGQPVARMYEKIGYVPQRYSFDQTFPITVGEFISLVLPDKNHTENKVRSVLESVKAEELYERKLSRLSGGQLQRTLLARALVKNPDLLILDEPEAGIDVGGEQTFYDLIEDLVENKNITALISSHELDIVYTYAQEVICLNRKMLCLGPPRQVLNQETFEELYGRSLKFYGHAHKLVGKHHH